MGKSLNLSNNFQSKAQLKNFSKTSIIKLFTDQSEENALHTGYVSANYKLAKMTPGPCMLGFIRYLSKISGCVRITQK